MPKNDYYLPTRKLVSQEDQSQIEKANIPRSRFMGSWTRKTTFDAGYLVPFMVDEILPGDHMSYDVTAYLRLSTPLFPIFDNQRVDTFFFFVPNRLVWTNWVKQQGKQFHPTDTIAYVTPQITSPVDGYLVGSLFDHFGLPTVGMLNAGATVSHQVLPLRAYNKIYNSWFRDQNLINSAADNMGDGPDNPAEYVMRLRAKSHDYFTSALPWPQKFTAPTTPLSGTAPVLGIGWLAGLEANTAGVAGSSNESNLAARNYADYKIASTVNHGIIMETQQDGGINYPTIYADLAQATGVSINAFRQAFMVQALLERDARGGTRYTELIRSHFGVINPDFRLQRPEYIGGGQTPLVITPIAQTTPTAGVPLGALGAAGTSAGQHRASYAATEHGYIIGLINVKSEISYQQGIHKMWLRNTRYDWYYPALAGLGEQAILMRELYVKGDANDTTVFGYQERWHELRTRYSEVTGMFKSTSAGTLDAWHLAQRFTALPALNQTFIEDTPPMARVLAAGAATNQQYLADIEIRRQAVRPVPMFGTPAILGRF